MSTVECKECKKDFLASQKFESFPEYLICQECFDRIYEKIINQKPFRFQLCDYCRTVYTITIYQQFSHLDYWPCMVCSKKLNALGEEAALAEIKASIEANALVKIN